MLMKRIVRFSTDCVGNAAPVPTMGHALRCSLLATTLTACGVRAACPVRFFRASPRLSCPRADHNGATNIEATTRDHTGATSPLGDAPAKVETSLKQRVADCAAHLNACSEATPPRRVCEIMLQCLSRFRGAAHRETGAADLKIVHEAFLDALARSLVGGTRTAETAPSAGTLVVMLRMCVASCEALRLPQTPSPLRQLLNAAAVGGWHELTSPADYIEVFCCCSRLRIGDMALVSELSGMCLNARALEAADSDAATLVELLSAVSFSFLRLKMKAPDVSSAVGRLRSRHRLTNRQALDVIVALSRLKQGFAHSDCLKYYSLHLAREVPKSTTRQLVSAMYAVAHGYEVEAAFCHAVVGELTARAHELRPGDLAEVCRCLNQLGVDKRQRNLNLDLQLPILKLTPGLSQRASRLLGQFTRSQTRDVLRCFSERKVRSGLLFARLCKDSA